MALENSLGEEAAIKHLRGLLHERKIENCFSSELLLPSQSPLLESNARNFI
jgi:hypothetical protein